MMKKIIYYLILSILPFVMFKNNVLADEYICKYGGGNYISNLSATIIFEKIDDKTVVMKECGLFSKGDNWEDCTKVELKDHLNPGDCPKVLIYFRALTPWGSLWTETSKIELSNMTDEAAIQACEQWKTGNDECFVQTLNPSAEMQKAELKKSIQDLNSTIDKFLTSNCNEATLGFENYSSCKNTREGFKNLFNNSITTQYKSIALIDATFPELTDVISDPEKYRNDEIIAGYMKLHDRINSTESDLNKYKIAYPIDQITCNYTANINDKQVNLNLTTLQHDKIGTKPGTYKISIDNGYNIVYGDKMQDYMSGKYIYGKANTVVFPTQLKCLPKIGYKVSENNINLASDDMIKKLYSGENWPNNFILTSITYNNNGEVTTPIEKLDWALENAKYDTRSSEVCKGKGNNVYCDWIFGGTQYIPPGFYFSQTVKVECSTIMDGTFGNMLKYILNILRFVACAILILFSIIDFVKPIVSGDAEMLTKSGKTFVKRLIIFVLILFLPALITLLLELIGQSSCNI